MNERHMNPYLAGFLLGLVLLLTIFVTGRGLGASGATKSLVVAAVGPLLGLLGTVSGMVEVFDVMAIAGSGNPRAMASGVYHAIIPTMTGMVAALSGMYFSARLSRHAGQEAQKLEDYLARH